MAPGNTVATAYGRGVGKSFLQELKAACLVSEYDGVIREYTTVKGEVVTRRGVSIIFTAPTFKQIVDVHSDPLMELLGDDGPFGHLGAVVNKSRWIFRFPGGSKIQFFGAENAHTKRGMRCDAVFPDECDDIPIGVWDAVMQPWLSAIWSLNMVCAAGTPRRGRQGLLYKLYSEGTGANPEPNTYGFFATYKDAPETVNQAKVEAMRRTMDPTLFAREWECSFESGEGLVYPMFFDWFHVRPSPLADDEWDEILVGGDWGFVDPGVLLVVGVKGHGADVTCHVLREVWSTQKSMSWWVDRVAELHALYPRAKWFYEHKPEFIAEVKQQLGITVTPADKARGLGIQSVADALTIRSDETGYRWSQLYVSPECVNLIREFSLYRYRRDPRDREKFLDDVDDSKNDHCQDALRYALYTRFGGPDRRAFSAT